MSFEVKKLVEPEHIRFTVGGNYSFDNLYEFIDLLHSAAESERSDRLLVDCRKLIGSMTEADRFRGGQRIAEVLGGRVRTAVVMPIGQVTKLGEITARNRGADLLVTECIDEAMAWLHQN
ncbi:MAG TPA: hypothetical protein PKD26_05270 [Pyrinomonadaceae bacterium]|nr:hypothetical protein [Pyrinomonadaceae bacterium]